MRLLLDTHILLWWMRGDRRLPKSLRAAIASTGNDVAVSAATFWEVAVKRQLGRIVIDLAELLAAVEADGFEELPIRFAHALRLETLPERHRDPFDRLLIAQSVAEDRRLVTCDASILSYAGVAGFGSLTA
jgi:PIN domain nuclease of toxin-antitoxin system